MLCPMQKSLRWMRGRSKDRYFSERTDTYDNRDSGVQRGQFEPGFSPGLGKVQDRAGLGVDGVVYWVVAGQRFDIKLKAGFYL